MATSLQVICPVRNGGEPFRQTLLSLRDNLGDFEAKLLISDNHSTDNRPWLDALEGLAMWHPEVVSPPTPLARTEHWNWAFERATGDIVKPMTSGDWLKAGACARMWNAFRFDPSLALYAFRNEVHEPDRVRREGWSSPLETIDQTRYLALASTRMNIMGALCGVAVRKDAMFAALPFEEAFPWAADWRFYIRCMNHGRALLDPEPLCVLNRRIARFSSRPSVVIRGMREEWATLRDIQKMSGNGSGPSGWLQRVSLLAPQAAVRIGRAVIPNRPRRMLGRIYARIMAKPDQP